MCKIGKNAKYVKMRHFYFVESKINVGKIGRFGYKFDTLETNWGENLNGKCECLYFSNIFSILTFSMIIIIMRIMIIIVMIVIILIATDK